MKQNGTIYALDMNSGLTQVLSDGTNTYTYGLSRISQLNTDTLVTDYFLGDALGSVRQLTNDGGEVTYAKSYTPYGESMVSAGSSESAYGFTGEQQDASGLTYLRARYYNAADGRFMSRDTWGGDDKNPVTLNKWNYGYSNPIIYVDPSGYISCLQTAEKYVPSESTDGYRIQDDLNTYTAGGIAIQCTGLAGDAVAGPYDGKGIAQISDKQASTPYGELVKDGKVVRGTGVLCHIKVVANAPGECTLCITPDEIERMSDEERKEFEKNYDLEAKHDQTDPTWAVIYMRRRIKTSYDACKDRFCAPKDKFIVAALAQNGPGFTFQDVNEIKNRYTVNNVIDWRTWFASRSKDSKAEYPHQLRLFHKNVSELYKHGYYLKAPDVLNDSDVQWLMTQ